MRRAPITDEYIYVAAGSIYCPRDLSSLLYCRGSDRASAISPRRSWVQREFTILLARPRLHSLSVRMREATIRQCGFFFANFKITCDSESVKFALIVHLTAKFIQSLEIQ